VIDEKSINYSYSADETSNIKTNLVSAQDVLW